VYLEIPPLFPLVLSIGKIIIHVLKYQDVPFGLLKDINAILTYSSVISLDPSLLGKQDQTSYTGICKDPIYTCIRQQVYVCFYIDSR